ncbi:MAG: Na+/H+ antiporter NhaA [Acidimicrobiales bacterium]
MKLAEPIRHTWSESDRLVPRTVVRPLQRVLEHEAAGGVVMLLAAVTAIVWANSPWSQSYVDLWSMPVKVEVGELLHLDHLTLQHWVNDALMTLFFLLVGVEIKRELVHGELKNPRAVALPVAAALGGMALPAVIYSLLNAGGPGADGWAIPTATDIAFAVGIVSMLGKRVPTPAKLFLLTLAVADDIGAIVIIAVFYTGSLSWGWLGLAGLGLLAIWAMRRADVYSLAPYLAVGTFVWLSLLESGVHATLAGVALGLLTPAWPLRSPRRFPRQTRRTLDRLEHAYFDRVLTHEEFEENEEHLAEIARQAKLATSPLTRLEQGLAPWVAYVVVPLFALANAGVALTGDGLANLASDRITLGVVAGLVLGKTFGVFGATMVALKLRIGERPAGTTIRQLFGLAIVAGVGFTVALFVASLSFDSAAATDSAKVGILLGSLLAGGIGFAVLRTAPSVEAASDDELVVDVDAPVGASSPAVPVLG